MERHIMTVPCASSRTLWRFTLLDITGAGISFIQFVPQRRWQLDPPWRLLRVATICCHSTVHTRSGWPSADPWSSWRWSWWRRRGRRTRLGRSTRGRPRRSRPAAGSWPRWLPLAPRRTPRNSHTGPESVRQGRRGSKEQNSIEVTLMGH